jgi:hypothetical protein
LIFRHLDYNCFGLFGSLLRMRIVGSVFPASGLAPLEHFIIESLLELRVLMGTIHEVEQVAGSSLRIELTHQAELLHWIIIIL